MHDHEIELVFDAKDVLGEGPVWDPVEARLFWTDIRSHCYHVLRPASQQHKLVRVGVAIGALGLREAGGVILATKDGFALHHPEHPSAPDYIGDPEAHLPETRFNDGAVDPGGRFWAGSYGGASNTLYRLDPDHSIHEMDTGFGVPNGIGWSLDGHTMYFTDSDAKTVYAYDFDPATGQLDNRRPFIETRDDDGVPDGLTVDAEGFIWSARWDGWRIERYDPEGGLERVVMMPVQRPTSCAFGGEKLDELYVSSANVGLTEKQLESQPQAGGLFRLHPGVKGREENRFKG